MICSWILKKIFSIINLLQVQKTNLQKDIFHDLLWSVNELINKIMILFWWLVCTKKVELYIGLSKKNVLN